MAAEKKSTQISLRAIFVLMACMAAYLGGPHYIPTVLDNLGSMAAGWLIVILYFALPIPIALCFRHLKNQVAIYAIGFLVLYGSLTLLAILE